MLACEVFFFWNLLFEEYKCKLSFVKRSIHTCVFSYSQVCPGLETIHSPTYTLPNLAELKTEAFSVI